VAVEDTVLLLVLLVVLGFLLVVQGELQQVVVGVDF
jgi:hypothetical protein